MSEYVSKQPGRRAENSPELTLYKSEELEGETVAPEDEGKTRVNSQGAHDDVMGIALSQSPHHCRERRVVVVICRQWMGANKRVHSG